MGIAAESKYALNRMNSAAQKYQLGTLVNNNVNVYKGVYDFSVKGGATGSINLVDDDGANVVLPKNFIVQRVLIYVVTAVTSGGAATIAFKSKGAGDLLGATAKTSFTLGALIDGVPTGGASTAIVMTADTTPQITIATAALTAGKINVHIEGVLSL